MKNNIYVINERKIYAFTLVELIVVITVLAILWTIWFISYNWYLAWVRDTNRISQLAAINDWLEVYRTKNDLLLPENSVEVRANGVIVWYQWYMWKNILETMQYSKWWIDPKDETFFSYYVTGDRKYFQLMAFLEDSSNEQIVSNNAKLFSDKLIPKTYAIDYTNRYPTVYWKKLWILTEDVTNLPIQAVNEIKNLWYVDLWTTTTNYVANFTDKDNVVAKWYALQSVILSRQWSAAPLSCPDWFIWVPWNLEFNQKWFCVAKYEMTYADANTPDSSVWWTDWNTMQYQDWKPIVSMAWKYPIADISQEQAISACRNMWEWYHLITNNEWMTIARNIEASSDNWSIKSAWKGILYNWVSWDMTLWCNVTWWNTETRTYGTKTWPWIDNTCNLKRKFMLSNWQEIYDFAWNVSEFVNKANTIDWINFNQWQTTVSWSTSWVDYDDDWIYGIDDMKKYGSAFWYWIANWVWNIWYADWVANNVFVRWDRSNSNANTWLFSLSLQRISTGKERYIGFRCAK